MTHKSTPPTVPARPATAPLLAQLQHAAALHQQGQLAEAALAYAAILQQQPEYFDALHLAAICALQQGDAAHAAELLTRALTHPSGDPAAYANFGVALYRLGRHAEAALQFGHALQLDPHHLDALYNLGNLLQDRQRYEAALSHYQRVLDLHPMHAEALVRQGNVLRSLGRPDAALASYATALTLAPNDAQALFEQALVLRDLGQHRAALDNFERILKLHPQHVTTLLQRGMVLRELKQYEAALDSYAQALQLEPRHALALAARGTVLRELGRYPEALIAYEAALGVQPEDADAWSNHGAVLADLDQPLRALDSYARALALRADHREAAVNRANALYRMERHEAALAAYDGVLQHHPQHAAAWTGRGLVLMGLAQYQAAQASYARALALDPAHAETRWNDALCRLQQGDFESGWQHYEARWDSRRLAVPRRLFPQALWLGAQEVRGRRLLIHAEQGLGDTLQFCRYVALLAQRGAHVVLEVQPELKTLLGSLAGGAQLVAQGEPLPQFDMQCPMLSLPLACRTTLHSIPANIPYLSADPVRVESWLARLKESASESVPGSTPAGIKTSAAAALKLRIGLAWRGSNARPNDARFLPLSGLAPLLAAPADFISLHLELDAEDAAAGAAGKTVRFFGSQLKDFAETAALLVSLDLVITVDTAVAHLAGALGRPVWILLPFHADWRWLSKRPDSPWYPTARLFRQPAPGAWPALMTTVAAELARWISAASLSGPIDGISMTSGAGPDRPPLIE
jgi:tetratricopeptide (TPR) repeat protein